MTNKTQIDKFRETARELECDESEESFARKIKKLTNKDDGAPDGTRTRTT